VSLLNQANSAWLHARILLRQSAFTTGMAAKEASIPALQNFTCATPPRSNQPLLCRACRQATCKREEHTLMMPFLALVVLVQFFAAARPLKIQIFGGDEKRRGEGYS
jgi:hypothetical protein